MKLTCEHITKTYNGKDALKDVSLMLESGKIYGLIGRNGAGKTTLLSILSAQNPATQGMVTLDAEPVWENRKSLANICFARELNVSAQNGLASMKTKEYLRIARTFYDNWDSEMEQKLIGLFGLEVKKKLGALSKGMLSIVTIIVALCSKAPFTFLDEPVSGLDVVAREQFYKLLLDEYSESGRTFVISTHIIEEAADVLEEVIILHEGMILLKENTQALIDSARHVSGAVDAVDKAVAGLPVCHRETLGRSCAVTVFLKDEQTLKPDCDVSVQPMNLQHIFVSLCAQESRHEA